MARPPIPNRHDHCAARQSVRYGAEKGIRIYIPKDDLVAAGIDPDGQPPKFRTWPGRTGSIMVRLYRD